MTGLVVAVGELLTGHLPILAGLAILENAFGEVAHLEAIPPGEFLQREKVLLWRARGLMPSLPFDERRINS